MFVHEYSDEVLPDSELKCTASGHFGRCSLSSVFILTHNAAGHGQSPPPPGHFGPTSEDCRTKSKPIEMLKFPLGQQTLNSLNCSFYVQQKYLYILIFTSLSPVVSSSSSSNYWVFFHTRGRRLSSSIYSVFSIIYSINYYTVL